MQKLIGSSFAACFAALIGATCFAAADVDAMLLRGEQLRKAGYYARAEKSINDAIRLLQRSQQKDPARLSGAYNYLSLVENNAGKYAAAEVDARRAIEYANEAGLGADVIAMHQVVLANALRQECKFNEAEKLLEDALRVLNKPSTNQQLLATAQNNLGAIYFWTGRYDQALPMLRQALALRRSSLENDHVDVANSYFDLGATEFKVGDVDEAAKHIAESYRIRLSRIGQNHPETLASAATLAVIYQSQGNSSQASKLLAKVVSTGRRSLGRHHATLAQYEDDYANVLAAEKQFAKARVIENDAMRIRKSVFGERSRDYAASLRSLAQIESAAGDEARSGELLKRSVATYKAVGQAGDPDLADTLDDLAIFFVGSKDLESARASFAESAAIRSLAGPTVAGAVCLANLSDVLERMRRPEESRVALENAKKVIDALPEPLRANPDCASILKRFQK